MQQLSSKQQKVLDYIRQYARDKGYPPSVREICEGLDLKSTSTVHGYLKRLEKRGYIRRDPARPRAIEIIDDVKLTRGVAAIPVIGGVRAGEPALSEQNIEEYITLPHHLVRNKPDEAFVMRVKGDSMTNAGILDGDKVVVQRSSDADNGDVVVALIQADTTIKRFYREDGYVRLQPENRNYKPIIVDDVVILGKVVSLIREF